VTINARSRFAALALVAVFAIGACSGGGSTASPGAPDASGPAGSDGASAGGPPDCLSFADIYALVGPESEGVTTWDGAATIAGELGSSTEFPADLPISITAPGEESGTYDSFVEIVLEDIADERGQEPTTRLSNYQSSSNDNAIIDGIANSAGSFGWVGFAFYEESLDRVRAFTISAEPNGTCIEPTAATIADNSYPISRDLFI
jgi:phosphate transport system substrate-binding protein